MIKLNDLLSEAKKTKETFEEFAKTDEGAAIKEFENTLKSISLNMTPIEFQREVGRLEVLGELLIREKK